jgi:diacylglycerol kinase (ATP)
LLNHAFIKFNYPLKSTKEISRNEGRWLFIIREPSSTSDRISMRLKGVFGSHHSYKVSEYPGHSILLAEEAVYESFQYVIAVGGDGTIHEVINGLYAGSKNKGIEAPALAILPVGTGNDFARTIGITNSLNALQDRLARGETQLIDLGKCSYMNCTGQIESRCFINVMDVGIGGSIAARVARYRRGFWAKLAYQRALLRELPFYKRATITCKMNGNKQELEVLSLVIANGKWFGKGIGISPYSSINDGILNGVIFGRVGIIEYILHLPSLVRCKRVIHPEVSYHEMREVSVDSTHALPVELDGEFLGYTPSSISVVPQAIRLVI